VTDKARPAVYAGLYGFDETPAKDEMGDGFDNLITGNLTSAPAYDEFWGYLRLATNVMAHGFWQERHSEYSYRRAGAEDAYFFSAQRSFESGDKGEALAYVLHGLIASGWSPIGGVGEVPICAICEGCCPRSLRDMRRPYVGARTHNPARP